MSRKRTGLIKEAISHLQKLLNETPLGKASPKLQLLLLLKTNPTATMAEAAEKLGIAERTTLRWWKCYCEQGIDGLLGKDHYNLRASIQINIPPTAQTVQQNLISLSKFYQFLNSLPTTSNSQNWVLSLKEGLQKLLPDVDRVTVVVNNKNRMQDISPNETRSITYQHLDGNGKDKIALGRVKSNDNRVQHLLVAMRKAGFPFQLYRQPISFEYYNELDEYVGLIVLWRNHTSPPISESTIQFFHSLQPFFTFVISDCVARQQQENVNILAFSRVIDRLNESLDLTGRELEVLKLHILGKSYQEIADSLGITINGVRKHVKSIHRKTETRTFTELFAKYCSPLG